MLTLDDLKGFATKDDLISFKDDIIGEIKSLREEVTVVTGYRGMLEDHEERISSLETLIKPA